MVAPLVQDDFAFLEKPQQTKSRKYDTDQQDPTFHEAVSPFHGPGFRLYPFHASTLPN